MVQLERDGFRQRYWLPIPAPFDEDLLDLHHDVLPWGASISSKLISAVSIFESQSGKRTKRSTSQSPLCLGFVANRPRFGLLLAVAYWGLL